MNFEIQEQKLKNLVFKFLDESPLSNIDESEPWSTGGIPFYTWETQQQDNEDTWEDPDIGFVYYEYPNSYDFSNTYDDDEFPLVEILEPYCTKLTDTFTEDIFYKYAPEWFEKELGREVKSVNCG